MKIVGLTGGIGSGKSTVSNWFKENEKEWTAVIDCDQISRDSMKQGESAYNKTVKAFGTEFLLPNGDLDRKKLGELVFSDKTKLKQLTSITGPALVKGILFELLLNFVKGTPLVILDAPTLFETGTFVWLCNKIIVVSVDEQEQIRRVMKRDKVSEAVVRGRMANQMPSAEKEKRADILLTNNGSEDEFKEKIINLRNDLKRKYGQNKYQRFIIAVMLAAGSAIILYKFMK